MMPRLTQAQINATPEDTKDSGFTNHHLAIINYLNALAGKIKTGDLKSLMELWDYAGRLISPQGEPPSEETRQILEQISTVSHNAISKLGDEYPLFPEISSSGQVAFLLKYDYLNFIQLLFNQANQANPLEVSYDYSSIVDAYLNYLKWLDISFNQNTADYNLFYPGLIANSIPSSIEKIDKKINTVNEAYKEIKYNNQSYPPEADLFPLPLLSESLNRDTLQAKYHIFLARLAELNPKDNSLLRSQQQQIACGFPLPPSTPQTRVNASTNHNSFPAPFNLTDEQQLALLKEENSKHLGILKVYTPTNNNDFLTSPNLTLAYKAQLALLEQANKERLAQAGVQAASPLRNDHPSTDQPLGTEVAIQPTLR